MSAPPAPQLVPLPASPDPGRGYRTPSPPSTPPQHARRKLQKSPSPSARRNRGASLSPSPARGKASPKPSAAPIAHPLSSSPVPSIHLSPSLSHSPRLQRAQLHRLPSDAGDDSPDHTPMLGSHHGHDEGADHSTQRPSQDGGPSPPGSLPRGRGRFNYPSYRRSYDPEREQEREREDVKELESGWQPNWAGLGITTDATPSSPSRKPIVRTVLGSPVKSLTASPRLSGGDWEDRRRAKRSSQRLASDPNEADEDLAFSPPSTKSRSQKSPSPPPYSARPPIKPSLGLLFSLTPGRQRWTLVVPAILLSISCGGMPPLMTHLIGVAFQSFIDHGVTVAALPPTVDGTVARAVANERLLKEMRLSSILLTAVAVGGLVLSLASMFLWTLYGERTARELRRRVFEGVGAKSQAWYDCGMGTAGEEGEEAEGTGGVVGRFVRETDDVRLATSHASGMIVQFLSSFISCLVLALVRSPILTLVILASIPGIMIVVTVTERIAMRGVQRDRDLAAKSSGVLARVFAAMPTVKAFNAEQREVKGFTALTDLVVSSYTRLHLIWGLRAGTTHLLLMSMFVQGFWFGSYLVRQGKATAGEVSTCFWSCLLASTFLQLCVPMLTSIEKGKIGMADMLDLAAPELEEDQDDQGEIKQISSPTFAFRDRGSPEQEKQHALELYGTALTPVVAITEEDEDEALDRPAALGSPLRTPRKSGLRRMRSLGHRRLASGSNKLAKLKLHNFTGEVSLKGVTFHYPSRPYPADPALEKASLYFAARETTYVVGGSGSGKSTVAQLVLGNYKPEQGSVLLEDQDLSWVDIAWLRSRVACVSQGAAVLFEGTVHDNVAVGVVGAGRAYKEVNREEVVAACTGAMIHEFFRDLPEGYDTWLTPESLSGGQRQRLAIARAWLRDPEVLILDEATSALDVNSRYLVNEAMKRHRRNKTTIIITHDLAPIEKDDFVYVMAAGSVVQQGYRSALELENGGAFEALTRASAAATEAEEVLDDDWDPLEEDYYFAPRGPSMMGPRPSFVADSIEAPLPAITPGLLFGPSGTQMNANTVEFGMVRRASQAFVSQQAMRRPSAAPIQHPLQTPHSSPGQPARATPKRSPGIVPPTSAGRTRRGSSIFVHRGSEFDPQPGEAGFRHSYQPPVDRRPSLAPPFDRRPSFAPPFDRRPSLAPPRLLTTPNRRPSFGPEQRRPSFAPMQWSPGAQARLSVAPTTNDRPPSWGNPKRRSSLAPPGFGRRPSAAPQGRMIPTPMSEESIESKHISRLSTKEAGEEVVDMPAEATPVKGLTFAEMARYLFPTIPNKFLFFFGMFVSVGVGACTPVFSNFLAKLMAQLGVPNNESLVTKVSLLILLIVFIESVGETVKFYCMERCAIEWTVALRRTGLALAIKQDKAFFDDVRNSPSALVNVLVKDADDMKSLVGSVIGQVCVVIAMVVIGVIWAFIVGWELTLVGLGVMPLFILATRFQHSMVSRIENRNKVQREEVSRRLQTVLFNVRAIRAMSLQTVFSERYEDSVKEAYTGGTRIAPFAGFGFGLTALFNYGAEALMFYIGALLIINGRYDFQKMLQVFSLIIFSFSYSGQIMLFLPQVAKASRAAADVMRLLNLSKETDEAEGCMTFPIEGRVQFDNVCFSYPQRLDAPVLRGVTFEVKPGECVGIVGPSGSGKSTVAALLQRLYAPTLGSVRLDGRPLNRIDVRYLRDHIAIVSQHPSLFDLTISENIAYGVDDASEDDIIKAAKAAHVHDFILTLPQGYQTMLGENASLISGGQAQRLQIARALLRPREILILDEATSALDPLNQQAVMETVMEAKKGKTTLIITHKLSIMESCDRLVVLGPDGVVAETGTVPELLAKGGAFAKLSSGGEWTS